MVKNFSNEQIRILLPSFIDYTDNKRYSERQFAKYLNTGVTWIGVCDEDDKILALAVTTDDYAAGLSTCFISEFQSIIKGHGKELIDELFSRDKYDIVYLLADINGSESLKEYYRSLGMTEVFIKQSIYENQPASFFCKLIKKIPPTKFRQFEQALRNMFGVGNTEASSTANQED